MDDASFKQLLWSADEYEASGFGRALRSAKGLEVLRAYGQDDPSASPLFGSLVRVKTPDSQYSAKYVHSSADDPESGQLQVVKIVSVSKTAGSRVSRRVPDNQLTGVQHNASGDALAIADARVCAAQLGLTDQELTAARVRMQCIRVLCDYCDAQQKLQELNPHDTEYLDAQDDVTSFSEILDNLIQQYKQITTLSAEQQQRQMTPPAAAPPPITAAAAAAAAVPLQVIAPIAPQQAPAAAAAATSQPTVSPHPPSSAVPVYPPPTLLTPQGVPVLTQQMQQQLYHMPHVLPASAAVPVCAPAAAMFPNMGLQYPMVPGLIPPTATAAVLPPGITMQQQLPAAAAAAFAVDKPYDHYQHYQQQQPHAAVQNFRLPPATTTTSTVAAAAAGGLGPDTATAAAAAPADSAAAVVTKPTVAAAAAATASSLLKAWRVSSRRPKYLVGSEPHTKTGQKMTQPGLEPAPECNLCYKEVDTLVWCGVVRWCTADGAHSGTFNACGHLYTPTAAADQTKSSSSSRDANYWLRYQQLPKTLEFTVDTRASTFESEVWSKPPPGGVTAAGLASPSSNNNDTVNDRSNNVNDNASNGVIPLSAGWDLSPLVLVPKGSTDILGLGTFMQLLRNAGGRLGGLHIARGNVQLTLSSSSSRHRTPLTGHTFISYNPNGPLMDLLQQQLLPAARKQWVPGPAPNTYDAKGLLYDSVNPVAVMTTSWWSWDNREDAFVPNAPPGVSAAVAAAVAAAAQMERQLQQQQRELAAVGWQRQGGPQQQQGIQGKAVEQHARQRSSQQQQSSSEQHSGNQHSGRRQQQQQQQQQHEVTTWATPKRVLVAAAMPSNHVGPLSPRRSVSHKAAVAATRAVGRRKSASNAAAHVPRSLLAAAMESSPQRAARSRSRDRVVAATRGPAPPAAAGIRGRSIDHDHSPDRKRPRNQYDMDSSSRPRARKLNHNRPSKKHSRSPSPELIRSSRQRSDRGGGVVSPRGTRVLQRLGSGLSPRSAGPAAATAAAVDDEYADIDRLLDQAELAAAAAADIEHNTQDTMDLARFGSVRSKDVPTHFDRDQQQQAAGIREPAGSRSMDSGRAAAAAAGAVDRVRSADCRDPDVDDVLAGCDVGRLHSQERDELRSLVLLHKAAAVAAAAPSGLKNKEGERIELELACEPVTVCDVLLSLDDLALPAALLPTQCSMFRFIKSSRSTILEQAQEGKFKVKRGYMSMIRRHKLLRRLLLKLTHDVQQQQQQGKGGSSSPVLTLRDVWEPVPGNNDYVPLQLYRMLYRSLVNFIADNVSGGPLGVMIQDKMFKMVPHQLIAMPHYRSKVQKNRVVYRLPHHVGAERKVLTVGTDTGWIPEELLNEQPPALQSTHTAAAAGDRWAPESDTDNSDHRTADLHTGHKHQGEHRDQMRDLQQQKQPEVPGSKGRNIKYKGAPVDIGEDQHHAQKPVKKPPTDWDKSMSLEPAVGPPATGRSKDRGPRAAAAAAGIMSKVRSATPRRDHVRSRSPSAAAAAAAGSAHRDSVPRQQQQQQQRSADPPLWMSDVLATLMARQDLSGLRNDERDELRSLALLHMFSAAVSRQESSSSAAGTLGREPFFLELACEPANIMCAAVCVDDLALPPHFTPSNCTVSRFIKSYRCSTLIKTMDKEHDMEQATVVPQYMDAVRSHRLLKRLLGNLVQALRQKHFGLSRIYFVRDMEETVSKPGFYHPLLMYKELYRNTKCFVADCVHLVNEVLLADKGLVLVPADEAVKPVWQDRERVKYVLPVHQAATRHLGRNDKQQQQQQQQREQQHQQADGEQREQQQADGEQREQQQADGEQQQQQADGEQREQQQEDQQRRQEEDQAGGTRADVSESAQHVTPASAVVTAVAAAVFDEDEPVTQLEHTGEAPGLAPPSSLAAEPAAVAAGPAAAAARPAAAAAAAAADSIHHAQNDDLGQTVQQQDIHIQDEIETEAAAPAAAAPATAMCDEALPCVASSEDRVVATTVAATAEGGASGLLGIADPFVVVGVQQQQQQQVSVPQAECQLAVGVTSAVNDDVANDSALVELLPPPVNHQHHQLQSVAGVMCDLALDVLSPGQQQQQLPLQQASQHQQVLLLDEGVAASATAVDGDAVQAALSDGDYVQLLLPSNVDSAQPAAAAAENAQPVDSTGNGIPERESVTMAASAAAAVTITAASGSELQQQQLLGGPGFVSTTGASPSNAEQDKQ